MKRANKMARFLALVMALCLALTTMVYAAEAGMLWLSVTLSENGKDTTALLLTDTVVTDGLIKVTYDPEKLTYEDILVSSAYVAMHAVNADKAGELLISWVAPNAYTMEGNAAALIEIHFKGTDGASLEITGEAHDADGNALSIGSVDTAALEQELAKAEALKAEDYTEDSWADLEAAVENAENTLSDPTATQAEVDAAAKALKEAIAALEKFVPADKTDLKKAVELADKVNEEDYTEASYSALEEALKAAKAVLADERAKQADVDAATKALNDAYKALVLAPTQKPESGGTPDTGDTTMVVPMMIMALVSAAAVVLLVYKSKNLQGR